jgi:hypothetical protein
MLFPVLNKRLITATPILTMLAHLPVSIAYVMKKPAMSYSLMAGSSEIFSMAINETRDRNLYL